MSLDDNLNFDQPKPFQSYEESIPETVPLIRADGRTFAGGKVILKRRLEALQSQNKEGIEGWGLNYFDLADASITYEDRVKFQTDSPLLTGIQGIVERDGRLYVAIGLEDLEKSLVSGGIDAFELREAVTAKYKERNDDGDVKLVEGQVTNVVLLPYDRRSMHLTGQQYEVLNGIEIKREDMIHGRDLRQDEVVQDGEVVHPVWKIYSAETVVPLVEETFKFNKENYDYNTNLGLFLPSEPQERAEVRALFVGRLGNGSRLYGGDDLGVAYGRSVGVV